MAGGWKLVLMEYLDPAEGWHAVVDAEYSEDMWQALEDQYCAACQRSPTSVHGDLRSTNIFVRK